MGLLDLLFPKKCVSCNSFGSYICTTCTFKIEYLQVQMCSYCYKAAIEGQTHPRCIKKLGVDGVVSLTSYQSPIKEIIKSLKYRFTKDLITEISQKLKFDNHLIKFGQAYLIPIPLEKKRKNYRGFNQAEILGKVFSEKFGLLYRDDLLKRMKATKPQVGLTQKQREENVAGAFTVTRNLAGETFYVFDDVWTSGATLKEVAKTLKKAGAKRVWGLTLAHPR